ncbi:MAG: hypothetical protein HYX49_00195 [Chloroflexi bacterium]|nr:hypothetical protein [Chloroflexota bacterium]
MSPFEATTRKTYSLSGRSYWKGAAHLRAHLDAALLAWFYTQQNALLADQLE